MHINDIIPELKREIDARLAQLKELRRVKNPEAIEITMRIKGQHHDNYTKQQAMSDQYSWIMEHPQIRDELSRIKRRGEKRKTASSIANEGFNQMRQAWQYLNDNPMTDGIDSKTILDLGEIINPYSQGRFRNIRASLLFPDGLYIPPNYVKISELVDDTISNFGDIDHPIEAAVYLHLRLTGIQPISDGNKRMSRLLQDRWLYEHDLPPAIIHPAEWDIYQTLLHNALNGLNEEDRKKVRPFFSYIGSKVNIQLTEALGNNYLRL
jgi:Fic family protein